LSDHRDARIGGTSDKASVARLTNAKDHRENAKATNAVRRSMAQIASMIGLEFFPGIMPSTAWVHEILCACTYIPPMTDKSLRIASYNIRKARGLDNRRMPERTLDVINGLNADIVVLQEADKRLGPRKPAIPRKMIESETDFDLLEIGQNEVSLGWHGNAVLLRPDLKVAHTALLDLPGLEPRGAVQVAFDFAGGFCVVATHLGLRRRDRRVQLDALRRSTQDSGHTVMAGDFNEWSEHRGFEALDEEFEVHTPGRTFHARRPVAALDRFAVRRGLQVYQGGVDEGTLARRASDHLPVWADILLPT